MTTKKWYIGTDKKYNRSIFASDNTPNEKTHGDKFLYCIGPFYTKKGAIFGLTYPFSASCKEIERLSKKG